MAKKISNIQAPPPPIPPIPPTSTGYSSRNGVEITTSTGNKIVIDDCFLQYLEMVSKLLGITSYEDFCKMTESEKLSAVTTIKRDLKIKEILC